MHVFILSVWREAETEYLSVFQSSLAYIVSGKPTLHGETLFKKKIKKYGNQCHFYIIWR